MTNLVSIEGVRLRYADTTVLDGVTLGIDDGDVAGVIGRNGGGKSTLLRVLAGTERPDAGTVVHARRLAVQLVPQDPDLALDRTALDVVLDADSEAGRIHRRWRAAPTDAQVHALMDARSLWDFEHVARAMLDRFGIDPDRPLDVMSGGQRMRVALARGLVHSDVAARTGDTLPLLLLDEPTNHLDLDAIEWLETRIRGQRGAVVLVTHDRYLLDRVTTRIVEIAGGHLHTEHGSYGDYLANRADRAQQAAAREHRRQARLRIELDWLQRSPPARTSKSRARIERAQTLLDTAPTTTPSELRIDLPARRLGSKVATLHNAGKRYDDRWVVRGVTHTLQPGARIGLVGPNGSGKTTLLQMIGGRLEPDEGSVRLGTTVHVGWYGQHTATAPERQRVLEAVQEVVLETNTVDGITLSSTQLLERFLFPPALQRAYVGELSGGERRRLELLRVLAAAPNLLLLDEPTNDLDLDTLAVVEDFLDSWAGTLVVASHDRFFLDRVCRELWSLEPDGSVRGHVGGWTAYQAHRAAQAATAGGAGPGGAADGVPDDAAEPSGRTAPPSGRAGAPSAPVGAAPGRAATSAAVTQRRRARLTYNEQRELRTLERTVPDLERRRDDLQRRVTEAGDDHVRLAALARELDTVVTELDRSETRWLELQLRREGEETSAHRVTDVRPAP